MRLRVLLKIIQIDFRVLNYFNDGLLSCFYVIGFYHGGFGSLYVFLKNQKEEFINERKRIHLRVNTLYDHET
jgi:hypothetical protein